MRSVLPGANRIVELIGLASTSLSPDILRALSVAGGSSSGNAALVIGEILVNCDIAARDRVPMCQDTGIPCFFVGGRSLDAADRVELSSGIAGAVSSCVASGILRPNAVDPLSGLNSGDGIGVGIPQVYFDDAPAAGADSPLVIDILLKGGGSENVGRQYSLPGDLPGAGRDMDGVRRCVIDAAFRAQGLGCSPGILGVCVGGDRASGMAAAKRQLLRRLDDVPGPFGDFERELAEAVNTLGIGPMGLGGLPTVLGVKVGTLARHPASFFVSIACGCWATRRWRMVVSPDGRCSFV